MTRPFSSQGMVGLWDLRVAPLTLGGTLALAADLHVEAARSGGRTAGLCLVGDEAHALPNLGSPPAEPMELGPEQLTEMPALRAACAIEGIDRIWYTGAGALQTVRDTTTWPAAENAAAYRYATTLHLSHRFGTEGLRPDLRLKPEHHRWAVSFLGGSVVPSLPVAVHLRNAPQIGGGSNADLDAWGAFFAARAADERYRFVIVGNDPLPAAWSDLPNVLLARDAGAGLEEDLAVIGTSFAFMGMASGPCNLAILTPVPYVIFKNPDDHPEHIQEEIGDGDAFPFARPNQRLLRAWETPDGLEAVFGRLIQGVDAPAWERRFQESIAGETGSG